MGLVSKAEGIREIALNKNAKDRRKKELERAIIEHIEAINSVDYYDVKEVEELLSRQHLYFIQKMECRPTYPKDLSRFTPSSADKCERELFYKNVRADKDDVVMYPFQRRWLRNSRAIHEAMQKQLLEAEYILEKPLFKVLRLDNGLPAWEKNIDTYKIIEHNGVQFVLTGMMDGILTYKDGSKIGFEYKTKTTSVSEIKRLKSPQTSHYFQCVAYSLLFDIDEFLIVYESVAKDKWSSGEEARQDIKAFYVHVTEKERKYILDKFARVADNLYNGEISAPDYSKCLFCPYKQLCEGV